MTGAEVQPGGDGPGIDLRVTAGDPTDDELAAITAVLHAAVREQAAIGTPPEAPESRFWQRGSRFLREPIIPGRGAWRSF